MKFTISAAVISSALAVAIKVISNRAVMPILDYVKLSKNESGKWFITASDMEHILALPVEMTIEGDLKKGKDAFCLPAKTLNNILHQIPDQPLQFDINEENLDVTVTYMQGHFSFMAQYAEEFHAWMEMSEEDAISTTFPAYILSTDCVRALPFVADDELRPVMNGVYFDMQADALTLAASDGHKLYRSRHPEINFPERGGFILGRKAISLLKQIVKTDDVRVSVDGKRVMFTTDTFMLQCALLEGKYPNYNSVFPPNSPIVMVLNRAALKEAVKRVSVMSNLSSSMIIMTLTPGEDIIRLSARDIDFSKSAEERLPATQNASSELSIGFKSTFLLSLIDTAQSEEVQMTFVDPSRASVMTELDGDDKLSMLIMPQMIT